MAAFFDCDLSWAIFLICFQTVQNGICFLSVNIFNKPRKKLNFMKFSSEAY